jgi:hypothetical protein
MAQSLPKNLAPLDVVVTVEVAATESGSRELQPTEGADDGHEADGQMKVVPRVVGSEGFRRMRLRFGYRLSHVRNMVRDLNV